MLLGGGIGKIRKLINFIRKKERGHEENEEELREMQEKRDQATKQHEIMRQASHEKQILEERENALVIHFALYGRKERLS